ncbi:hypothetical protein ABEB36_011799 [Hypothenemus hampei]|uniref:Protein-tyrosine-phosphatase n=1 Tax=Hypothenemus hampei TaxID=57062 RepID=A0ABD1E969_HYPHA
MEVVQRINTNDSSGHRGQIQDIFNESLSLLTFESSPAQKQNTNDLTIVTDHLILTSAASVRQDALDKWGVTCLICAAPELPDLPLNRTVAYHKVNISDQCDSNIDAYFDYISDVIDEVSRYGGRTWIFCVAGVSRSATLCIAYLMKKRHLTLAQAYDYVKGRRPKIRPNCGFFRQLISYENTIFLNNTVHMVFNDSVKMYIPDVYDKDYRLLERFSGRPRRQLF